jgi:tetratricopeptide (TPR) repeat protein
MAWPLLTRWKANRTAGRLLREGRDHYYTLELGLAEPLLRDAYEAARSGASPALLAATAEQHYYMLRRMKRYVEAVPVIEAWLTAQIRYVGVDTDEVRNVRNELTWIYGKLDRFGDAERVSRERLASARRRNRDGDRETGFALVTVGWALLNQGRADEAETVYREALALLEELDGVEHGVNGWALLGLAAIAVRSGDIDAAETELLRAVGNWDKVGRSDMAGRTRERLMDLYLDHAEFAKAAAIADSEMRQLHRRGWGSDRRRARNLEQYARALRGAGREDEARRLETRAGYLRAAIEKERTDTAESRQRLNDNREEPPGAIFEGEEDWPLATPVFIY